MLHGREVLRGGASWGGTLVSFLLLGRNTICSRAIEVHVEFILLLFSGHNPSLEGVMPESQAGT